MTPALLSAHTNFSEKRRLPRLSCRRQAQVLVSSPGQQPEPVSATISSVSPDGLGIEMGGAMPVPYPDSRMMISFRLGQRDIQLPGIIAWSRRTGHGISAGIRLNLDRAPSAMRQAYASWIVDRLGRELSGQRAQTAAVA